MMEFFTTVFRPIFTPRNRMQDSYIENDVELEYVIFDKAVTMRANGRLIGQKQYPIVIGKNVTL